MLTIDFYQYWKNKSNSKNQDNPTFSCSLSVAAILGVVKRLKFYFETNSFFESNYVKHIFSIHHVYFSVFIVFTITAFLFKK